MMNLTKTKVRELTLRVNSKDIKNIMCMKMLGKGISNKLHFLNHCFQDMYDHMGVLENKSLLNKIKERSSILKYLRQYMTPQQVPTVAKALVHGLVSHGIEL